VLRRSESTLNEVSIYIGSTGPDGVARGTLPYSAAQRQSLPCHETDDNVNVVRPIHW
jgi:hypothetical protein